MSSKEAKDRLRKLTMLEYNKSCANCKAPRPTWTSLIVLPEKEEVEVDESIPKMLGVFICFRCSAIQRRIGSNFCSVKRMALDMCKFLSLHTERLNPYHTPTIYLCTHHLCLFPILAILCSCYSSYLLNLLKHHVNRKSINHFILLLHKQGQKKN